ncbi:MAG: glycosyltransferase family 4 protein [Acidobacteria bacterium]|nr:glycosyltransferase family 4 protein [Acidobacteriota bacterium]
MRTEPRRVLMSVDAVGGVWTYALDLADALGAVGVDVLLACLGPRPSAEQAADAARLPRVELACCECRLEWMDDPWDDVQRSGEWLLALERRFAPDLVHLNGYAHAALPFEAPVLVAGHSCVCSWARAIPGAIDPVTLSAYAAHVARGLHAADMVVAPSRAMLDALEHHYGPLVNAAVVHNGRRRELFSADRKEPFIFSAGRLWDQAKNVAALTDVAARLPWPTAVAGSDALDPDGERRPLPGVRSLGRLDERTMAGWLARASILALPARYEPFGLLPLEAALSGCALVLGDIPSLREVWGDTAEFVPPCDRDALAATLMRLIASPRRLTARAEAARDRAVRYTTTAMRDGYLAAYARAAAHHHPTPEDIPCAS